METLNNIISLKKPMIRLLTTILFTALIASCNSEYKKCELSTNDTLLRAYNDILTEIITNRSYYLYMGEEQEKIAAKISDDIEDSLNIERYAIQLHNKLFGDTARFCTIYLDTLLKPEFDTWSSIQRDTNRYYTKIRNLINSIGVNGQTVIDSLNTLQVTYKPQDYKLCIADVKSMNEYNGSDANRYIGKLAFSKLIFNDRKDKGLLYYNFTCGGLCGYGCLLLIERVNDRWVIKQSLTTWIS